MRLFSLIFLTLFGCAGFEPLYIDHRNIREELNGIYIITDKTKMSLSIKKGLLRKLPPINNQINYIIKLETKIENNSTITSTDRKTSGYEIITKSKVSLYKRLMDYDKKILSFEEKSSAVFEFSPNQVLSTLASRNRAFQISADTLSKNIMDRIIVYFKKNKNDY